MINKYSCIFLFLLIASSVFTQNRISVDQTNIDFNDLPEIIVEKENNEPYTGRSVRAIQQWKYSI